MQSISGLSHHFPLKKLKIDDKLRLFTGKLQRLLQKPLREQPFSYRYARSCAGFLIFIKKYVIIYIEVMEKLIVSASKSKRKGVLLTMPYTTYAN